MVATATAFAFEQVRNKHGLPLSESSDLSTYPNSRFILSLWISPDRSPHGRLSDRTPSSRPAGGMEQERQVEPT